MVSANRSAMLARVVAVLVMLVYVTATLSTASARQAAGAAGPQFDVASVKPNKSGDAPSSSTVRPGGLYVATNVTLRALIQSAFGVRDQQIVGGGGLGLLRPVRRDRQTEWQSSDGRLPRADAADALAAAVRSLRAANAPRAA